MEDKPFESLIDETAAGLKVDPEIYLETRRELRTHLEAKAEQLQREGHTPEESVDLARKWFGSPMDVAAELLSANRQRMRLRSLVRLGFNAVFIPLVIVAALYVGYGRAARGTTMVAETELGGTRMPTVPFFHPPALPKLFTLLRYETTPEEMLGYYNAHRSDPDAYVYYAYYASHLDMRQTNGEVYVRAMHYGEKVEPRNALYNLLLSDYYLNQGMKASTEKNRLLGEPRTDDLLNREAFEQGIAEWRKAVNKPYLSTHHEDLVKNALDSMPQPVFFEDYTLYTAGIFSSSFPFLARQRELGRKIPGCARILAREGRKQEAVAVMDTWRRLPEMQLSAAQNTIQCLVASAVASIFSKQAGEFYRRQGLVAKAEEAESANARLKASHDLMESARHRGSKDLAYAAAPTMAKIMLDVMPADVTEQELTAGRMAEYAMAQWTSLDILLTILAALLVGTVVQGAAWLYRLRRAAAVPLLLMPPAKEVARAVGLGVVLPFVVYVAYIHIPVISGRDHSLIFGFTSGRLEVEIGLLGLVALCVPASMIHRYVRRRCRAVGIETPDPRQEARVSWSLRSSLVAAAAMGLAIGYAPGNIVSSDMQGLFITYAILAAAFVVWIAAERAGKARKGHGLYYGTVARSMATVYAFTILFITVVVQPMALHSEIVWARKDVLTHGYLVDKTIPPAAGTLIEARYTQKLKTAVEEALND